MSNELVVIEKLNAVDVFKKGGIRPIIDAIRKNVSSEIPDVSTLKGRKNIASNAYKVSQSKTLLDNFGKGLADELNDKLKPIHAERKLARDELDSLRDEIRKPLNDWENKEVQRVESIRLKIDNIVFLSANEDASCFGFSADVLKHNLVELKKIKPSEDEFSEFYAEALSSKDRSISLLEDSICAREKYEEEQAELERLRKESADREQKDRDDRIAKEAAAEAVREEQERHQAARRKEEQKRIDAELQFKAAAQRLIDQEAKSKQDAIDAIQKAEDDKNAAIEDERRRAESFRKEQEELKRKENELIAKKAAGKAHQAKINNQSVDSFVAAGYERDMAIKIVTIIAKKSIQNITINY
jgi:hypothetical protein